MAAGSLVTKDTEDYGVYGENSEVLIKNAKAKN
jgi:acetyltransferase-like isoleucine patch superfamily enzyme